MAGKLKHHPLTLSTSSHTKAGVPISRSWHNLRRMVNAVTAIDDGKGVPDVEKITRAIYATFKAYWVTTHAVAEVLRTRAGE